MWRDHPYARPRSLSTARAAATSSRVSTAAASLADDLAAVDSEFAIRPPSDGMAHDLLQQLAAHLDHSYADNTNLVDESHWRAWEEIAAELGTPAWRTDVASHSGADPAGYRNEQILMALALLMKYVRMHPRSHSDPAADPNSAMAMVRGVCRAHARRGITLAQPRLAARALRGLCRAYVDEHGVRDVRRKKPLDNVKIAGMLNTPEGAVFRGATWTWASYAGTAHRAWLSTLSEGGERKDEIAKKNADTPFVRGRLTFASLVWKLNGVEVAAPSMAQLDAMSEAGGDGVYLKHGRAKNDFFGAFFAATPSFHPFSVNSPRCAARALRELERAAALAPAARASTPLFGPTVGAEFTHAEVEAAFFHMLHCGGGVPEAELDDFSIHSLRIFVACALMACGVARPVIKRLLRWRGDESLEIYARLNDDEWRAHVRSTYAARVDSTVAARLASIGPIDLEQIAPRLAAWRA